MEKVVKDVLGGIYEEIEDGEHLNSADIIVGLPQGDSEYKLSKGLPYAPVRLPQVEVHESGDHYIVTRAREIDTGNPENMYGKWYDLSDFREEAGLPEEL